MLPYLFPYLFPSPLSRAYISFRAQLKCYLLCIPASSLSDVILLFRYLIDIILLSLLYAYISPCAYFCPLCYIISSTRKILCLSDLPRHPYCLAWCLPYIFVELINVCCITHFPQYISNPGLLITLKILYLMNKKSFSCFYVCLN